MATRALLIDLDGVVYIGDEAIPGAKETLAWLDEHAIPRLFLTNTSSRPRSAIVTKLQGMGFSIPESQIMSPAVTAREWLRENIDGPVALFTAPGTVQEFDGITLSQPGGYEPVAAVVIGDYGERWSFDELNRAFRLLMEEPRPALVALGMTRYWRAPDGLRLDTAPFVMALSYASGIEPLVLGKPALPFYQAAMSRLGATADQTLMVGDDIRTDIDGAQAVGIRGILVRTGKFRASDMDLGIRPYSILDSFADLPAWWEAQTLSRNARA